MKKYCQGLLALAFFVIQNSVAQTITHGPVISGVTSNSARIYIRTNLATSYTLEYSADSNFVTFQSAISATQTATDSIDIITLSNLLPSTTYYFRYRINNAIQTIKGRFKTFPNIGTEEHLVIVTGSCQETANMKVFDAMPTHNPDLFIHLGDFSYPSYQIPRYYGLDYPTDPNAVTLAWQKRHEEPVCKDMLKKVPLAYMPDDDDSWGNSKYYKGGSAQIRYENGKLINYFDLIPRTATMRQNCLQAYKTYFPGYPLVNDTDGYYHSFKIGNSEFFMIDTRSCNTGGWKNLNYNATLNLWTFNGNNATNTLLNQPQLNWLLNGLKNSTAHWKFIVSGVPFNQNIQKLVELPLLLQNTTFNIGGQQGTGFRMSYSFSDYFGAYTFERNKILNFIRTNNIKNVIVISGDTHGSAIDDGTNAGLPEMNASGLSVRPEDAIYTQFNAILAPLGFDLKKWLWNKGGIGIGNSSTKNSFGKIEVFGSDSVRLCILDEDNQVVACHTIKSTVVTSMPENKQLITDAIQVWPNPVQDVLNIQLNTSYSADKIKSVRLVDINGKWLLCSDFFQNKMSVSDLASGYYFIAINYENALLIQPFIKQ